MGGLPSFGRVPLAGGLRRVEFPVIKLQAWFLGGNWGLVGLANGDLELVLGGGGGGTLLAVANCNNSAFLSGTGGFCPGTKPWGSTGRLGWSCRDTWSLAMGGEVSVSELDGYECNLLRVPPEFCAPAGPTTAPLARIPLDESTLPFLPMSEIHGARPGVPVAGAMLDSLLPDLLRSDRTVDEPDT